jgi:predicted GH43/DUF377 family glycosyl hydrolase
MVQHVLYPRVRAILLVACILLLGSLAFGQATTPWQDAGEILAMGSQVASYILWNDPSVMQDGSVYRMWLSGGDARNLSSISVSVYEATSADGKNWAINPQAVVIPDSNKSAWDGLRIETPSVVKVGGIYHLYYTGFNSISAVTGISQIGHAVSTDGIHWTKDSRNPILTGQTANPDFWGYGGAGEPGIVYNPLNATFYLYYVGLRYSTASPTIGQVGILLAKSTDGSHFTPVTDSTGQPKLILSRDVPGAINGSWFGYTAPSAVISSSGEFHLFTTFVVAPQGPTTARNVLIAESTSTDGVNFTTINQNIVQAGLGDWKDQQVGSPSAAMVNGKIMMWYAGNRMNPFGAGIGMASRASSN